MTQPPLPDDARPDLLLPFGPIADAVGRDVILSDLDGGGAAEAGSVLDIFAGVGQMACSYAKAGCRVQAVDSDRTTVESCSRISL
jgi:2-polyprenyl-3-methyl-5-hydroxy-6-metoxy-1,4-benzoquinol methylase